MLAILLWASLALLTTRTRGIPPFELLTLSFAVAFGLGMVVLSLGGRLSELRQPWAPWLSAFAAIYFYHALYFFALKWAPPAQASLVNYLWPLFIVLLSSIHHANTPRLWIPCVIGGAFGFIGTGLTLAGSLSGLHSSYWPGYLAAFACACVWSSYSVFNRRFHETPSGMLVGVCGAVAVGGLLLSTLTEHWAAPNVGQWIAIVALGAGPTGLAFFAWDHATKHGHLTYLGLLSYLAPLMSTALLILAHEAEPTPFLLIAAALITGGALVPKLAELLFPQS